MSGRKIGLFGGTFNPIHCGHLQLAKNVLDEFGLDELQFIPSNVQPHKSTARDIDPEHRANMVRMAVEKLGPEFTVSDIELTDEATSYTYRTLKQIRERHPDDALFFICGTDIFASIGQWQYWEELFSLANFIVASRSEMPMERMLDIIPSQLIDLVVDKDDFAGQLYGRIILYRMKEIDISSTEIRNKLYHRRLHEYLPQEVYDYIERHRLYQEV